MLATILIGFLLVILLAALTLLTNPPSTWIGKRDSDRRNDSRDKS